MKAERRTPALTRKDILDASNDMMPVHGTVDVAIPLDVLWNCFVHANWWPKWNKCFFWVWNQDLVLGRQLIWAFEPIRWWYLYKMPATATIVEREEQHKVTWEVTALPGFYARHSYSMQDLGGGVTRFGSWEKAMGWEFRMTRWFWISHFTFVKDRSLEGGAFLEEVYRRKGQITDLSIQASR